MPSRVEGFGLVYIEAMRHSLPVVASIHNAGNEINLERQTGYNVDMNKIDELPDRSIYLLKNLDRAALMGLSGQQWWAEHFRYGVFKARFLSLLKEFVETC